MATVSTSSTIVRTERGLTVAGTRITLYSVMDYLRAGWPPQRVSAALGLDDSQMAEAMAYLEAHREEVEAEYEQVLEQAGKNRQHWEEHQRDVTKQRSSRPPSPESNELRAKLRAWREQLDTA